MDYVDELLALVKSLNDYQVEYVLIGGAALNVHGLVRATEDVDLFVAPNEENVERLKSALRAVWSDPDIEEIQASDLLGEYPVIRYGPPEGTLYLDLITRLGEQTSYDALEWEQVVVRDVPIRVATPEMLFRLKRQTQRPVDRADAERLARAFNFKDDD